MSGFLHNLYHGMAHIKVTVLVSGVGAATALTAIVTKIGAM